MYDDHVCNRCRQAKPSGGGRSDVVTDHVHTNTENLYTSDESAIAARSHPTSAYNDEGAVYSQVSKPPRSQGNTQSSQDADVLLAENEVYSSV